MKPTVLLLTFCVFAFANSNDPTQIEKYDEKVKTYKLEVPGKEPITIIETAPSTESHRWQEIAVDRENVEVNNLMTHIIHDIDGTKPRCYGPSCQVGFIADEGPQKEFEDFVLEEDKLKRFPEVSKDRLEAITELAAKLKKDKFNADRYSSMSSDSEEDNEKVYTTWNRLKVKQHKHPYDDKDGWVTLEPVAWSSSKISKWKPNIKKYKPNIWNDDQDRFPSDDPYNSYQEVGNTYNYPQKKPQPQTSPRPQFMNNNINNLHYAGEYDTEMPSRPSWTKPTQSSFTSSWSPDDSRRPHKPNCDSHEHHSNEDTVYYGMTDSVVTDHRPNNFPYDYEALHQAAQHRPMRRPTQVVYAGTPEYDSTRASRPPYGDGQWVLLSTTKGYRNKKRQRSLNPAATDDHSDHSSVTSHQAVALTVLPPVDGAHANMTTSHGGMLEVEKSFQTVEESKRDMDRRQDIIGADSEAKPTYNRVVRRKVVTGAAPDSSSLLAAVGAGMVPATMAMVVPLMLGRRRRRDLSETPDDIDLNNIFNKYQ